MAINICSTRIFIAPYTRTTQHALCYSFLTSAPLFLISTLVTDSKNSSKPRIWREPPTTHRPKLFLERVSFVKTIFEELISYIVCLRKANLVQKECGVNIGDNFCNHVKQSPLLVQKRLGIEKLRKGQPSGQSAIHGLSRKLHSPCRHLCCPD